MPAVLGDGRDNTVIEFTRTGWSNPAGIQRPTEQRVRYRFIDGSLVREHWLSVDPALNTEPRQRVLLTQVRAIEVRFLDPTTRQWRNEWPAATATGPVTLANIPQLLQTRPLAIEFSVVFEDWGRVQRLFEIPT
jgi:general secretion pathway protein J